MMTTKQKNSMASYRMSLIRHRRRTFLLYKETGMQKWARMLVKFGKAFVAIAKRLLVITEHPEDGPGIAKTWHIQNRQHHTQTDYILARKRFRLGVNTARTQSFPRADIGSDHDLLMMTFHLRIKTVSKPKHTRLKFDLEKLKYHNVLKNFQAIIGTPHYHEQ